LSQWQINVEGRWDFELLLSHLADDSDDFDGTRRCIGVIDKKPLPDGRTVSEEFLRKWSANHRDRRTIVAVLFGEVTSIPQRNRIA
jgi:hypothetical protein